MTRLNRGSVPRMKPIASNRTTLVAGLDIGTSKVACLIGRLRPCQTRDALSGRSHAIDVIGMSQIQARGMKAGAVIDAGAAEQSVRQAVAIAEEMAGVRVESVVLSIAAGRMQGQLIEASAEARGGTVSPGELSHAMGMVTHHATGEGRTTLHALPVGYSLDGVKGIRDPRGMVAKQFGLEMNVVTADATVARNLMLVVERCHLTVEAVVASPYVAGLSVLSDDESAVAAAVIDMGAGTTTVAVYSNGRFVHAFGFAVGGNHITMDLARGLGACVADAERIKTLYGTVLTGGSDARELMTIPSVGDHEGEAPQIVSRGTIANIISQRAEEIFEMIRDGLADSPFAAEPRARVVITGGASQLTGIPELASRVLNRPVRIGRPLGVSRLPNEAKNASFAVPTGLLVYPQYAHLEFNEPVRAHRAATGTDGYFGRVGRWLREGF